MQVYILLSCNRCKWWRKCKGTTEELKDLVEHKPCVNCHGPRKFKCPKCGNIIKSRRIQQDDPREMKALGDLPPSGSTPPPPEPQKTPETPKPAFVPPLESKPDPKEIAKILGHLIAKRLRGES